MVQAWAGDPSFQSMLAVTAPPELSEAGVVTAKVAIPVLLSHVAWKAPVGGVTSGSGTEIVVGLPARLLTTARTLSDAVPGPVVTVGDHDAIVTFAEARVAPPLVNAT